MRKPMAHHDLAGHADALELGPLERGDVESVDGRFSVKRHVDERARRVLDGLEALVEAPRALELLDELCGYRLSRHLVNGVALENRGLERPVLEDLRRELEEILQHACAGQ